MISHKYDKQPFIVFTYTRDKVVFLAQLKRKSLIGLTFHVTIIGVKKVKGESTTPQYIYKMVIY